MIISLKKFLYTFIDYSQRLKVSSIFGLNFFASMNKILVGESWLILFFWRDNAKERKTKVKNRRSEVINMGSRITREERY